VLWSLAYLVVRRLLELMMLCCRSPRSKELEILVLRHEPSICAGIRGGPWVQQTRPRTGSGRFAGRSNMRPLRVKLLQAVEDKLP
jgi:hypothetical protein